jgi:hypothetical protein
MARRQNIRKGFGFDNINLMSDPGYSGATGERPHKARERRF